MLFLCFMFYAVELKKNKIKGSINKIQFRLVIDIRGNKSYEMQGKVSREIF